MSTHASIVVQRANGKAKVVYVHFDGYPSGVGKTLLNHYKTQEQVEALVLGDISSLGPRCDGEPGHTYDTQKRDQTVYYGRDRGEDDADGEEFGCLTEALHSPLEHFTYVWSNGEWRFGRKLTPIFEEND